MTTKKALKDMTLEELWKLFPIVLTQHQPQWKKWATYEIASLSRLLADYSPIITHIGSTAIPDILAKPIIDLLVKIQVKCDWPSLQTKMENAEYICMSISDNRMSFNKGYTPDGFADRVFHIHVRKKGDNDEIYFKDYLIKNPKIAHEYELLKSSLLPKFKNNRDGYTAAKTEFVNKIMGLAKKIRISPPVTTTDPEVININHNSVLSFSIEGMDGTQYILLKVYYSTDFYY